MHWKRKRQAKGCPNEENTQSKNALCHQGVSLITQHKAGELSIQSIPDFRLLWSLRPFPPKGTPPMKHAPKPSVETPGPRRPDPTPREILDIAAALQARDRARLSHLSPAGRFRKWGTS